MWERGRGFVGGGGGGPPSPSTLCDVPALLDFELDRAFKALDLQANQTVIEPERGPLKRCLVLLRQLWVAF